MMLWPPDLRTGRNEAGPGLAAVRTKQWQKAAPVSSEGSERRGPHGMGLSLQQKLKSRGGLEPVWQPFSDVMGPRIFDQDTQKHNSIDSGVRIECPRHSPLPLPLFTGVGHSTRHIRHLLWKCQYIDHKILCNVQTPRNVTRRGKQ